MPKKFIILLEDDWEVWGNGLGNVAQLQYLPSLFLMKTLKKLGATMTFMVEVVQQLRYYEHDITDRNLHLQRKLWEENVLLMKDYGFDVQLHLHPQWFRAKQQGQHFLLNSNWNIGRYSAADQAVIVGEGIDYLETLVRQVDPAYKTIAFKGGSWGLQPSETLFAALEGKGVRIVMGVRNGLRLPNSGTDYTNTEERVMPYYPDYTDIRKVSREKTDIVIIPQPEYSPSLIPMMALGWDMVRQKYLAPDLSAYYYGEPVPAEIRKLSPLIDEKKLKWGAKPYQTHLKIGNQPYTYLKASFDDVIKRLDAEPGDRIPILLEAHTKNFLYHYAPIEKFLHYILDRYGDKVEFGTMTQYLGELDRNAGMIRRKSTNN